jgi:hypothetical protein
MEQVKTMHRILLSQSFRFGPAIAEAATKILLALGADQPVQGLHSIPSHLASVHPQIILARTNAGVISNILTNLRIGCHVLGGTRALYFLLTDVQRIRMGQSGISPELLGFNTWKDVRSFSLRQEEEHLRGLVNLIQQYSETIMLEALSRCVDNEDDAQILCSTVHKVKGREWEYVRIDPDFPVPQSEPNEFRHPEVEAELRLLYVAVTRARIALDIPLRS